MGRGSTGRKCPSDDNSGIECCDALRCSGPHARYTDADNEHSPLPEGMGNLLKLHRDGASSLQFWNLNEEFLVRASHQLVLITSLPFLYEGLKVAYKLVCERNGG
jgi:hypothetical protein